MKMKIVHFIVCLLIVCTATAAYDDIPSLIKAVKAAKPGDTLVLANGTYKNAELILVGNGSAGKPIVIKAATQGKVLLTGNSFMKIGGEYLEVNGFHFTKGSTVDAVIEFRRNNETLANNC